MPDLILGNYEILDRLGAGGMGTVYRARHRRMKRIVAVKILPCNNSEKAQAAVLRFQREVEVIAQLSHPNIVAAYDADEAEVGCHLVMELVDGNDLAREVKAHGPLPVRQAVGCILQAALGLEYAHSRGVVHRDIKPANLLWDRNGTVKVTDLGLARVHEALAGPNEDTSVLTQSGHIFGTVDFMPPEQAHDFHAVDPRGDIYSLGCTLYFLVAGRSPYPGRSIMETLLKHREEPIPSLREAAPDVSRELEAVYRKMVAKTAEERFQSMTEVIDALQACGFLPEEAGSPTPTPAAVAASDPTEVVASETAPLAAADPDDVEETAKLPASRPLRDTAQPAPRRAVPETVATDAPRPSRPRPRPVPDSRGSVWLTLLAVLVVAGAGAALWWMLGPPGQSDSQLRGQWVYDDGQGTQALLVFQSETAYALDFFTPEGPERRSGLYRLSGDQLSLQEGEAEHRFRYRLSGDQLALTPIPSSSVGGSHATRAVMTFQRQSP